VSFAIASDLSGVIETKDGFGSFATELEAIESLIERLEAERAGIADVLAEVKRRRRSLRRST
jgi:uncharacterized protein (UPF0335 family)